MTRSIRALAASDAIDSVICAIRPEHRALYDAAVDDLPPQAAHKLAAPVHGGAERSDSVAAALEALEGAATPSFVLVHDAARPFLPGAVIDRLLASLAGAAAPVGAIAALPVVDTLRRGADGLCGEIVPRDGLWRAQTPQAFRFETLLQAHRSGAARGVTDDAEAVRVFAGPSAGQVALVDGASSLRKITLPEDFAWAEEQALLQEFSAMTTADPAALTPKITRVGSGFDVHKFGPNADGTRDHCWLCGVAVPHDDGLVGHSDADVGLHALTDAVLGAMGLGDIGRHFPPSDETWRGAASDQFLAHAVQLVRAAGGEIIHLDATLICERPKIGPHAAAMRARVAEIVGVGVERVSVKATTTEGLGFPGRREGVAAMAAATVLAPLAPVVSEEVA